MLIPVDDNIPLGPAVPLAQPGPKVLRVPVRPVRRSVPPVPLDQLPHT
jgi:hypothetical protein